MKGSRVSAHLAAAKYLGIRVLHILSWTGPAARRSLPVAGSAHFLIVRLKMRLGPDRGEQTSPSFFAPQKNTTKNRLYQNNNAMTSSRQIPVWTSSHSMLSSGPANFYFYYFQALFRPFRPFGGQIRNPPEKLYNLDQTSPKEGPGRVPWKPNSESS